MMIWDSLPGKQSGKSGFLITSTVEGQSVRFGKAQLFVTVTRNLKDRREWEFYSRLVVPATSWIMMFQRLFADCAQSQVQLKMLYRAGEP